MSVDDFHGDFISLTYSALTGFRHHNKMSISLTFCNNIFESTFLAIFLCFSQWVKKKVWYQNL